MNDDTTKSQNSEAITQDNIKNSSSLTDSQISVENNQSISTPTQTQQRNNKLSLIIGLTLFVFVVAILAIYIAFIKGNPQTKISTQATPTTTITQNAEWQTFTNQELNFSVDYPNNWQTKEFTRDFAFIGKSNGVAFRPVDPEIVNENWGLVTVEVEDNPKNLTVDDFINNYLCDSPGVCASADKAALVTVSGVQGKKVVNPPAPVPSQIVVLINKGKIFTIVVTLDRSVEELYSTQQKEEIYNKILNSFKFIDSITAVNNWPLYKSKNYNLSFRYRTDLNIEEKEKSINLAYMGTLEPYDKLFHATIYVIDNPNKYTAQQYAETELCKDAIKFPDGTDTTNYCLNLVKDNMESYKNNSVVGIKTQYNLYENPTIAIIFPFEDKLILFVSSGETGGLPTEMGMQTIDQILSTFQFSK